MIDSQTLTNGLGKENCFEGVSCGGIEDDTCTLTVIAPPERKAITVVGPAIYSQEKASPSAQELT